MDKHFFSVKEVNKEETYKHLSNMQRERIEFDRERVKEKLSIERENIDMENQEKLTKLKLQNAMTMHRLEREKERVEACKGHVRL